MHTRCNEVRYSVGEYAGFPRTSPCNDEQWTTVVFNGIALVGVELRQVEGDALIAGHFARADARDRIRIGNDRGPRT